MLPNSWNKTIYQWWPKLNPFYPNDKPSHAASRSLASCNKALSENYSSFYVLPKSGNDSTPAQQACTFVLRLCSFSIDNEGLHSERKQETEECVQRQIPHGVFLTMRNECVESSTLWAAGAPYEKKMNVCSKYASLCLNFASKGEMQFSTCMSNLFSQESYTLASPVTMAIVELCDEYAQGNDEFFENCFEKATHKGNLLQCVVELRSSAHVKMANFESPIEVAINETAASCLEKVKNHASCLNKNKFSISTQGLCSCANDDSIHFNRSTIEYDVYSIKEEGESSISTYAAISHCVENFRPCSITSRSDPAMDLCYNVYTKGCYSERLGSRSSNLPSKLNITSNAKGTLLEVDSVDLETLRDVCSKRLLSCMGELHEDSDVTEKDYLRECSRYSQPQNNNYLAEQNKLLIEVVRAGGNSTVEFFFGINECIRIGRYTGLADFSRFQAMYVCTKTLQICLSHTTPATCISALKDETFTSNLFHVASVGSNATSCENHQDFDCSDLQTNDYFPYFYVQDSVNYFDACCNARNGDMYSITNDIFSRMSECFQHFMLNDTDPYMMRGFSACLAELELCQDYNTDDSQSLQECLTEERTKEHLDVLSGVMLHEKYADFKPLDVTTCKDTFKKCMTLSGEYMEDYEGCPSSYPFEVTYFIDKVVTKHFCADSHTVLNRESLYNASCACSSPRTFELLTDLVPGPPGVLPMTTGSWNLNSSIVLNSEGEAVLAIKTLGKWMQLCIMKASIINLTQARQRVNIAQNRI